MTAAEVSFRCWVLTCATAAGWACLAGAASAQGSTQVTGTGAARSLAESWSLQLRVDPDLSAAARAHARDVAAGRGRPQTFLDQLKKTPLGDAHVAPFAAVGRDPNQVLEQLEQAARPPSGSPKPTHIGAGWARSGERWVLVAVLAHRWVEWQAERRGNNLHVTGHASERLQDEVLELWVLGPCDFERSKTRCAVEKKQIRAPLRFEVSTDTGFRAVEVLADTETGPTVVGLWWLSDPGATPHAGSRNWVNVSRKAVGVGRVRPDLRLARAARAHAQQICPLRWAAHQIGPDDGPGARARAEGYLAPVGENVAVASSRRRAHQNLWRSPPHHELLVDPDVVVYGEAEVRSSGRVCIVQLFGYGP